MKRILLLILLLASCSPARELATPHPTPSATLRTELPNPFGSVELPQCTVTAEALHIRSGAGIEYPVTGYLRLGDVVTVINQRGAWLDIGDGWIHSHYCEE
jgi:uncharacterized protein YgiM (DUF1202 family)